MRRLFRLILLVTAFCSTAALYADEYKDVLLVVPYDRQSSWSKIMMAPLDGIEKERTDIRIRTAVINSSSISTVGELDEIVGKICEIDVVPELIVIYGPGNYILADDFNSKWPGVPVIMSGELDYVCSKEYVLDTRADKDAERVPLSEIARSLNMSFVQTGVFLGETLDLMQRMKPGMKDVYFIGGEEFLSRELQLKTEEIVGKYHPELSFIPLSISEISTEQLVNTVINIDEQSGSLIYCNWHKKIGSVESIVPQRGVKKLIEDIRPLYSCFYSDLGGDFGQIGYVAYDYDEYLYWMREYIMEVLDNNVQPKNLPFYRLAPKHPTINYNALNRFSIDMSLVPEGSYIVNRPATFFETYRKQLIYFLTGLIVFILIQMIVFTYYRSRLNEKRAREAETKSAMKSMFIQNMSHDVRTPINAIVGFSQLLGLPDGSLTEEEKAEYNELIANNSNMLMMLVDDILSISDIEAGIYHINKENTSCNEIARASLKCTETRAASGVSMTMSSEVEDSFSIYSDPRRIQQILVNYLTNACKHTMKGSIHIHVSISENPGRVTFSVTDTGTGVPEDQAERIFERFSMLDPKIEGTGLGLNICRTISEKLHGEVRLDTSYKEGARFILIVPVA